MKRCNAITTRVPGYEGIIFRCRERRGHEDMHETLYTIGPYLGAGLGRWRWVTRTDMLREWWRFTKAVLLRRFS